MTDQHRRRVGSVRPSHLMFTSGVGALVDLPNFSVLIKGLDDWNHDAAVNWDPIAEPRLLKAVQTVLGDSVKELRPAPWLDGTDQNPTGPAARVGVPTAPFPAWLRCTACHELAAVDTGVFRFENDKPRKPQDARFYHDNCGRKPLAVAARFVLSCTKGHLDEFPYVMFAHRGVACAKASHPRMRMEDRGGNLGANVRIQCVSCGLSRNIREALGRRGEENLPLCRGRHPHLATFDPEGCAERPKVLVVGASNQWFAQTMSALHVPRTGASELEARVEQHWDAFKDLPGALMLPYARANVAALREFTKWTDEEIWAAVERHRGAGSAEPEPNRYPDLRTAEWEIFTAARWDHAGPTSAPR